MQQIAIEDVDFIRLQKLAVPLVDTPASVVAKLLDQVLGTERVEPPRSDQPATYGPSSVPPLTHAKVMGGAIAGRRPHRDTWDGFVVLALNRVFDRFRSLDEIRRVSGANVKNGKKEDEGYKFLPALDFSYQGVSAEDAVKIVFRCARGLGDSVNIDFVWRDKEGAHKPGERGTLKYSPE